MDSSDNDPQEDVHICGGCRSQFSDIDLFLVHKRGCVTSKSTDAPNTRDANNLLVLKDLLRLSGEAAHHPDDDMVQELDPTKVVAKQQTDTVVSPTPPEDSVETDSPVYFVSNNIGDSSPSKPTAQDTGLISTQTTVPLIETTPEQPSNIDETSAAGKRPKVQLKFSQLNTQGIKRYKCEYISCNFTTSYMKDLERHFRIHTGEKPYVCSWNCGKRFNRSDKLKAHERWHLGQKPHRCDVCDYATGDKSSLKKHLRMHNDERPFKCQVCPYASRSSSQLVVHLRTHTGDTPFHCDVCSMKFKINSDLKRHMRRHTGEKPFACSLCDYRCSIKGNLKSHKQLKHSNENAINCSHCDFVSASRKLVRDHERIHVTKPLSCEQCLYSTDKATALRIHQRVHSVEKPFRCEYCEYMSKQACNVLTHIKKKHAETLLKGAKKKAKSKKDGVKPACRQSFSCIHCEASFVREDSLRSHLRQHQKRSFEPAALAMLELQQTAVPTTENNSSMVLKYFPMEESEQSEFENGALASTSGGESENFDAEDNLQPNLPPEKENTSPVKTVVVQSPAVEAHQNNLSTIACTLGIPSVQLNDETNLVKSEHSSAQLLHQMSAGMGIITIPILSVNPQTKTGALTMPIQQPAFPGPRVTQPAVLRFSGLPGVQYMVYQSQAQPSSGSENVQLEMANIQLHNGSNLASILQPALNCVTISTAPSIQSAPTQVLVTSPLISQGSVEVHGLNFQSTGVLSKTSNTDSSVQ